jgi:translation initiation factor RLI1
MNDKLELLEAYLKGFQNTLIRRSNEYGATEKIIGQLDIIDILEKQIQKLKEDE